MKAPTYQRVREVFDYDPDTGLFRWRVTGKARVRIGMIAGYANGGGYIGMQIDGYKTYAHRLAWFWITGSLPPDEIDHKNKDRTDNRWGNLREASHAQNEQNKGVRKNNRLGIRGVSVCPDGQFMARIWRNGRTAYIGTFRTAEEASAAYLAAARELHGDFCYA